jgi:hypothetical protein
VTKVESLCFFAPKISNPRCSKSSAEKSTERGTTHSIATQPTARSATTNHDNQTQLCDTVVQFAKGLEEGSIAMVELKKTATFASLLYGAPKRGWSVDRGPSQRENQQSLQCSK